MPYQRAVEIIFKLSFVFLKQLSVQSAQLAHGASLLGVSAKRDYVFVHVSSRASMAMYMFSREAVLAVSIFAPLPCFSS